MKKNLIVISLITAIFVSAGSTTPALAQTAAQPSSNNPIGSIIDGVKGLWDGTQKLFQNPSSLIGSALEYLVGTGITPDGKVIKSTCISDLLKSKSDLTVQSAWTQCSALAVDINKAVNDPTRISDATKTLQTSANAAKASNETLDAFLIQSKGKEAEVDTAVQAVDGLESTQDVMKANTKNLSAQLGLVLGAAKSQAQIQATQNNTLSVLAAQGKSMDTSLRAISQELSQTSQAELSRRMSEANNRSVSTGGSGVSQIKNAMEGGK
jgi:hypothetical protein